MRARAPSGEGRRVSYPVSDSMSCIRRARVPVPCAELARRIERTDGLGNRFIVQQFKPTPPARASNLEHLIAPDYHRDRLITMFIFLRLGLATD